MTKRLPMTKEELPEKAFALVGNSEDPDTWQLPHHQKSIFRALRGKFNIEKTVDWERMDAAVATLSLGNYHRLGVVASPEQILVAAGHLANHYRKVGKPLPDTLAALV
jgi:uncharacterized membrane protein YukC